MHADDYRQRIANLDKQLGALYRQRRALMEAFADEHPAVLPPPRLRSETQARVARCPRCSGKLENN